MLEQSAGARTRGGHRHFPVRGQSDLRRSGGPRSGAARWPSRRSPTCSRTRPPAGPGSTGGWCIHPQSAGPGAHGQRGVGRRRDPHGVPSAGRRRARPGYDGADWTIGLRGTTAAPAHSAQGGGARRVRCRSLGSPMRHAEIRRHISAVPQVGSGEQRQGFDVVRTHDGEVSAVEGRHLGDPRRSASGTMERSVASILADSSCPLSSAMRVTSASVGLAGVKPSSSPKGTIEGEVDPGHLLTALQIGYARVSTNAQDLTAQRDGLFALGVDPGRIYVDHGLTGTSRERPGLARRWPPAARATPWWSPRSTGWPARCPMLAPSPR